MFVNSDLLFLCKREVYIYIYIYVSLAGYMDMLCNYQNCYVLTIIVLTHQRMHMIWSKVYF